MIKVEERETSWVFIAPLDNLELTDHVNNEFQICRVLLVSRDRLPYIRKRLGFKKRISELKRRIPATEEFFEHKAFAVVRLTGEGKLLKKEFTRLVKKELDILSLSQLGYGRRRISSNPNIDAGISIGRRQVLMHDTVDSGHSISFKLTGNYMPLILEGRWKAFQKKTFFFNLLNALRGEYDIQKKWKDTIERAAILVGQSQYSNNIAQSFLWNMIALEVLLIEQGDKYLDMFPERVEAFIGWAVNDEFQNIEKQIRKVYQKRCQIVHNAKIDIVSISDLLFTDTLLLNVFHNILNHLDYFSSKSKLIQFSKKIQAKKLLRSDKKIGPKSLKYLNPVYSKKDYEII